MVHSNRNFKYHPVGFDDDDDEDDLARELGPPGRPSSSKRCASFLRGFIIVSVILALAGAITAAVLYKSVIFGSGPGLPKVTEPVNSNETIPDMAKDNSSQIITTEDGQDVDGNKAGISDSKEDEENANTPVDDDIKNDDSDADNLSQETTMSDDSNNSSTITTGLEASGRSARTPPGSHVSTPIKLQSAKYQDAEDNQTNEDITDALVEEDDDEEEAEEEEDADNENTEDDEEEEDDDDDKGEEVEDDNEDGDVTGRTSHQISTTLDVFTTTSSDDKTDDEDDGEEGERDEEGEDDRDELAWLWPDQRLKNRDLLDSQDLDHAVDMNTSLPETSSTETIVPYNEPQRPGDSLNDFFTSYVVRKLIPPIYGTKLDLITTFSIPIEHSGLMTNRPWSIWSLMHSSSSLNGLRL